MKRKYVSIVVLFVIASVFPGGTHFYSGACNSTMAQAPRNSSPQRPSQNPPPKPNPFIQWLKNIAGIRKPLVLLFPDGKVVPENSLTFRWGGQLTNPDHFILRIFERVRTGPWQEIFVSPAIGGDQRSYTKTPGVGSEANKTYKWRVEVYEKDTRTFTLQDEQGFSFLNAEQLARIQQRESVYLEWIRQRPDEKHLLLLVATYYAAEGMPSRAREMFSRFLESQGTTVNTSVHDFRELTTLVRQHLERVEKERNETEAKRITAPTVSARVELLKTLRTLNLILLDYEKAITNVDALIAASTDTATRQGWQQTKEAMLAERALAVELFPAGAVVEREQERQTFAAVSPISINLHHQAAKSPKGRNKNVPSNNRFKFELDPSLGVWYQVDDEFVKNYPSPDKDIINASYFFGEEFKDIISGMWLGKLFQSVQDSAGLRRAMFGFMPRLGRARNEYFAGKERTPTLDEAWSLIPETRTMAADQRAFVKFGRLIYPIPLDLGQPETMEKREELIRYLRKHLEPPRARGSEDDERYLAELLFYNLFLVRTSAGFRLSAGRGTPLTAVDSIEVVNEKFTPIRRDMTIAQPPDPEEGVTLMLNGSCSELSKKLPPNAREKMSKALLVYFNAKQKGLYRLHVQLRSGRRVIWRSPSFGLYFI